MARFTLLRMILSGAHPRITWHAFDHALPPYSTRGNHVASPGTNQSTARAQSWISTNGMMPA